MIKAHLERKHKKFEQKYCAKYGREKYLRSVSKYYWIYLSLTIVWSIVSITQLLLVIKSFQGGDLLSKIQWSVGLGCGVICAILWGLQIPYYKIKSKECKDELKKASKPE